MLQRGCLTGPCQPMPGILTAHPGCKIKHHTGPQVLDLQVPPPEHYAL